MRDTVACLWVRHGKGDEVRVVPDGCVDLVWRRGEGVTLAGPDTSAKLVSLTKEDLLIGMRFHPGAGGGILGIPLDSVRDLRVDAADVSRRFHLDAELAPEAVVTAFVRAAAGRPDPLVAAAAGMVERRELRAIARELSVSERQLRRRFHAAVGYGPKTLARVLRFRRFVGAVDAGRNDLAALALDSGYADQAHMTREVTRLSGLPPRALIQARS